MPFKFVHKLHSSKQAFLFFPLFFHKSGLKSICKIRIALRLFYGLLNVYPRTVIEPTDPRTALLRSDPYKQAFVDAVIIIGWTYTNRESRLSVCGAGVWVFRLDGGLEVIEPLS